MAKQSLVEWNNYGVFGLPCEREALFEGFVGEFQRSWDHPAVFLARKETIRVLGSDAFFQGAPRHVGGKRSGFAYESAKAAFCKHYEFYCKKVRAGDVLVCEANIRPYKPWLEQGCELKKPEGKAPMSRNKEVGNKALKDMTSLLRG